MWSKISLKLSCSVNMTKMTEDEGMNYDRPSYTAISENMSLMGGRMEQMKNMNENTFFQKK